MEPLTRAVRVVTSNSVDVQELADVAARTFPLACPPSMAPGNIAAFVAANLSAARFAEYLADPHRAILTAEVGGRIIGYAMLIRDGDDTAELSKIYLAPEHHGTGAATALMDLALATAGEWGVTRVWLGVNQGNERAQRFYAKSGFAVSGTRTFRVGAARENDFVMSLTLG
ncbi:MULTISPECIES: GNAT family N-acetyltransferase [unclassified Mycobacterium]|uniref:GNAT family N-acetyltransferase n=1 Tax=unclassified Mycobacterium TaxID=2642494 RepID=UPI0007FE9150|nr:MULTISPECIES: GNAT family N-acetyltransferase [unclassified Mycobacterium]OBG59393.1 acetyltransferase [Mycobacterium sp. E3339]OBH91192.1 acetyltransferase [Mycobacterium sp. E2989]